VDFPVLEELAERGFTDWYGAVSGFEADSILDQPGSLGMACSWSTDRPGGFSDENIRADQPAVPDLRGQHQGRGAADHHPHSARAPISGTDAAQRVWSGATARGSIERVEAAIFFSDLRGFTAFAGAGELGAGDGDPEPLFRFGRRRDRQGRRRDPEIHGRRHPRHLRAADANVCEQALRAARTLCRTSRRWRASGGEAAGNLDLGIALHKGEVLYGNVGTPERLDFTMIGPAVNEGRAHGKADQEPGLRDPGLGFVPGGLGREPAPAAAGGRARHLGPQRATRALRRGAGRQGGGVTICGCRH
jgi:adenylate cyclase